MKVCALGPANPSALKPLAPITPRTLRQTFSLRPDQRPLRALSRVSDITYIPTQEGWLYLALVLDLFSRAILGWKLGSSLHATLVTGALRRALDTGLIVPGAIFHSDRGCQYTAGITRALLARHGLCQSMSAAGFCYDNAFAESAFASLKSELFDEDQPFPSKAAASTAIFDYLETFYNRKRLHSSLDYLSPQSFLNRYFQNQNPNLN